ncbi:TIGR03936 family radical SAM-associated protein [Caloramator sp. CAR-1]|uniref:TIGR03936 family radical SAM-associated protein n=1 Tax=Caloramator sp. CAR-1 TaxID=3062777 RepID=UPI0026E3C373|nr:TIGR03936 family radical SAM-associated protein [Caloramator sp. CAR-1]MDO6355347.1 TIGR03936 family radical SAM-associated protein [Caloramator sp. CAR-1]
MVRYLIKFQKTDLVKFLSHLDTLRTLHRAIKRAKLPIVYSKGFNPHPSISIASPLSVGIGSLGEYADIELEGDFDEEVIRDSLNQCLPKGLYITDCIKIKSKKPSAMSVVEAASYQIQLACNFYKLGGVIEKVKNEKYILRIKRTKSGEKEINIRPMIYEISLENNEKISNLKVLVQNSNKGSLNPEMLIEVLRDYGVDFSIFEITRLELYAKTNDFIALDKFFRLP